MKYLIEADLTFEADDLRHAMSLLAAYFSAKAGRSRVSFAGFLKPGSTISIYAEAGTCERYQETVPAPAAAR